MHPTFLIDKILPVEGSGGQIRLNAWEKGKKGQTWKRKSGKLPKVVGEVNAVPPARSEGEENQKKKRWQTQKGKSS